MDGQLYQGVEELGLIVIFCEKELEDIEAVQLATAQLMTDEKQGTRRRLLYEETHSHYAEI